MPEAGTGRSRAGAPWEPRRAREDDTRAIGELIALSARRLGAGHYTAAQVEAALGPVFGVDAQLIRDGTYYVVPEGGTLVGCGGWSRRESLFGGDGARRAPDPELDPRTASARVRAYFVHPDRARRGIGACILALSERAMAASGFGSASVVATLPGEPLYASFGYRADMRYSIALPGGLGLPVVAMSKALSGPVDPPEEPEAEREHDDVGHP
jgi:hypothetical protein